MGTSHIGTRARPRVEIRQRAISTGPSNNARCWASVRNGPLSGGRVGPMDDLGFERVHGRATHARSLCFYAPGLRRSRGAGRVLEPTPLPTEVIVEPEARNETGSDPAGHRLQFAVADQCADIVLGTAQLDGNLADREGSGQVHHRSIAKREESMLLSIRGNASRGRVPARELRPLLDKPVELVLPTHGEPADRAALEQAPALDVDT
jgi:hypothetical protein